ncbi:MAG: hypothetical protein JOZ69_18180 [Myxococcales bacterium]|nr:hypothetical protein [Myxococcales bacterium]
MPTTTAAMTMAGKSPLPDPRLRLGLIVTCHAVAADHTRAPQNGTTLAIVGFGESLNNVAFALVFIVLAALAASYGAFRVSKLPGAGRPTLDGA